MKKYAILLATALPICAAAADDGATPVWLTVPEQTWAFVVKSAGFASEGQASGINDRTGKPYAAERGAFMDRHVVMSVFIEARKGEKNAADLRDSQWPESRIKAMPPAWFKKLEIEGVPCAEFEAEKFDGKVVHHRSLHCYWTKGDWWAEIHLSQTPATDAVEPFFKEVIASADFAPGSDQTRLAEFVNAGNAFNAHDYENAIRLYERLWKAEQEKRTIESNYLFAMLDNLGMAYGISGDLNKARAHFDALVKAHPDYPFFHYNLACAMAEGGDLDGALRELRSAFALKKNVGPMETLADPRTDSSFARFRDDPKFKALMNELGF